MTQEQKAKAYDEAIRKAQDVLHTSEFINITDLFPELKESEDEQIRNEIICYIGARNDISLDTHNRWLSWLEKQGGENNQFTPELNKHIDKILEDKIEPKFHEGDIIKPKDGGHEPWQIIQVDMFDKKYRFKDGYVIHFSQEDNYELVEQKPANKVEPKFHVGDKLVSTKNPSLTYEVLEVGHINELGNPEYKVEIFTDGKAKNPRNIHNMECHKVDEWGKLIEQKPSEWSEEDEITRNALINLVEMYYGSCINQSEKDRLLSWLKSLGPKPKQEWREEDEKRRKNVLRLITEADDRYIKEQSSSPFCAEILWLKSLKDRITWKPSEKQIGALNYAYCELFKRKDVGHNILGPLQELCDELKKL